MKVQWYMQPAAAEWVRCASNLLGLRPGVFIERLVRYHAGDLSEPQIQALEQFLEVAANAIAVDFDDDEEEY